MLLLDRVSFFLVILLLQHSVSPKIPILDPLWHEILRLLHAFIKSVLNHSKFYCMADKRNFSTWPLIFYLASLYIYFLFHLFTWKANLFYVYCAQSPLYPSWTKEGLNLSRGTIFIGLRKYKLFYYGKSLFLFFFFDLFKIEKK